MTTTALFVYGTLKPGQSRWPALRPYVDPAVPPRPGTTSGRLWDTGRGWPAMTTGTATVAGTIVNMNPATIAQALQRLDGLEGVVTGLFIREEVVVDDGTNCWVYLWPHDTAGFTELNRPWGNGLESGSG